MNNKLILETLNDAVMYTKIDLDGHLLYEQSIRDGSCNPCNRPSLSWAEEMSKKLKLRHKYACKALEAFEQLLNIDESIEKLSQEN